MPNANANTFAVFAPLAVTSTVGCAVLESDVAVAVGVPNPAAAPGSPFWTVAAMTFVPSLPSVIEMLLPAVKWEFTQPVVTTDLDDVSTLCVGVLSSTTSLAAAARRTTRPSEPSARRYRFLDGESTPGPTVTCPPYAAVPSDTLPLVELHVRYAIGRPKPDPCPSVPGL